MYDQLPDKSYVQTRKCVCNVIETKDGVRVEMTDGTIEEGDILLGCDGVHSKVRELMWKNANEIIPNYITVKEKTCELRKTLRPVTNSRLYSSCHDFHGSFRNLQDNTRPAYTSHDLCAQ
jgi:2-polyprenyl-6-methoxyphenol hydroxylase-like FAD-dependent oxidoreductase